MPNKKRRYKKGGYSHEVPPFSQLHIDIYKYTEIKSFLRMWYSAVKNKQPIDYHAIAFALHRSYMSISFLFSNVRNQYPVQMAEDLAGFIGINKKETKYFKLLCLLAQPQNKGYINKIEVINKFRAPYYRKYAC